jgi:hypothetical protein
MENSIWNEKTTWRDIAYFIMGTLFGMIIMLYYKWFRVI